MQRSAAAAMASSVTSSRIEEGRIVLVGNETDVLHCGYSYPLNDGGKRYPSAEHYAHCQILHQLGLTESLLLELLCVSSPEVPAKARQLLQEHMPKGHDMNTLASYLQRSRQSYTLQGLRLRIEQDAAFEKALMATREALIVVCDSRDSEFGIGMDEQAFLDFMNVHKANVTVLGQWMALQPEQRPPGLGLNQLGSFLMWLRYEVREKRKAGLLNAKPVAVEGISTDQEGQPVKVSVSELVISLTGIFRPLSNHYALPFEMKGERYRSVEHYAYEKLLDALRMDEKITTTPDPYAVAGVAAKIFDKYEVPEPQVEAKMTKMDRWRQSAMKHKIMQAEYLQQLLLSTGDALLADCYEGATNEWLCGASESELQHLLTKDYISAATLVDWMCGRGKLPYSVGHLKGNKTGLLLMELRAKLAASQGSSGHRIPLIAPLATTQILSGIVSPHMICFTPESVFHPLYPAEIRTTPQSPLLKSPIHYVATQAIKTLCMNTVDADYILEPRSSIDCWQRLHEVIEQRSRGLDLEQAWWMEMRQKAIKEALALMFEQHPPLQRALLDTGDAMLVCCSRFSSAEAELTVGMRERDLRVWMHAVDISTKQLLELCTRPMAFRPPFLGGNRLGLILMELRREFILKGAFPQELPLLPQPPEVTFGTDSPSENLVVAQEFDVLDPLNYEALWINPLFILAKAKKDSDLMQVATSVKTQPQLVSVNEERIEEIIKALDEMMPEEVVDGVVEENGETAAARDDYLLECEEEELRAVFLQLCMRIRHRMVETDNLQSEINFAAREVSEIQAMRRRIEELKKSEEPPPNSAPVISAPPAVVIPPPTGPPQSLFAVNVPPPVGHRTAEHRRVPSPQILPPKKYQPRPAFRDERRSLGGNDQGGRGRREEGGRKSNHGSGAAPQGRGRSPPPAAPQPKKDRPKTPPPAPPPVKKVRPPDEELSDGEILDSDED